MMIFGIVLAIIKKFLNGAERLITEWIKKKIGNLFWTNKKKIGKREAIENTVYAKKYLMTVSERKLYEALKKELGEKWEVFTKVRILDVIGVRKTTGYAKAKTMLGEQHYDFVITAKNGEILLCIELDDPSHETEEAEYRDWKKNTASVAS